METNKSDVSDLAFKYIHNKDIDKLHSLLASGVHPDTIQDEYGNTALEKVSDAFFPESADLDIFKMLLQFGADPNKGNKDYLLHRIAFRFRNDISSEMILLLLNAGGNINILSKRSDNCSLLQSACYGGMLWLVEFLLEKGADLYYKDDNGLTALNYVVNAGKNTVEIIDVLLKNGADKNDLLKMYRGSTCFDLAKTPETIAKIASLGININMKNSSGEPGIFHAAEYGSSEIFEMFLDLGAEVVLHQIIHRITYRMRYIGGKEITESHMKKFKMLYDRGYEISPGSSYTIDWIYERYNKRKKITKYEEQSLLDLLDMGCRPKSSKTFQAYADKVNSVKLQNKINELQL